MLSTAVVDADGLTYYRYELTQHRLLTATAYRNRVFLMALSANGRQWRKGGADLLTIRDSFRIETA